MSETIYPLFCPCPQGIEKYLSDELKEIAQEHSKTLTIVDTISGGVSATGSLTDCYLINLYSRIASRVLLRIAKRPYKTTDDLFRLARIIPWERWFKETVTIRIDTTAIASPLKSLNFATLRIKDGLVDRFSSIKGVRPSVDTKTPDIRVSVFLTATDVNIYLDTSGEPLFKRGWREVKGAAPIRENLAAALLRAANWKPGIALLDPMCGSGTILIEAAMMAMNMAPGLKRHFAFENFLSFDPNVWQKLKDNVQIKDIKDGQIFGSDISGDMIEMAKRNIQAAGIFNIPLRQIEAQAIKAPAQNGILLTNPPYGERIVLRGEKSLSPDERISTFYKLWSKTLKQDFAGWSVYIFTADLTVPKLLRLKESKRTPFYNGSIDCRLFEFKMVAGSNR